MLKKQMDNKSYLSCRKCTDTEKNNMNVITHVGWLWSLMALFSLLFFPVAIAWCWICVEFNQGAMLLPKALTLEAFSTWWYNDIQARIIAHALPNRQVWLIYLVWNAFQALLFALLPGPTLYGSPICDGKTRLKYTLNGQNAWFVTLLVVGCLHLTNIFPLTILYDQFAPLLSVSIIFTSLVVGLIYLYAMIYQCVERQTDSIIYDYFMGAMVNPRIGNFDVKFFFELRPGIMQWFFTTLALAAKQYETYGTISTPMALICFYHLCFVNACYKGEGCVIFTIDIIYEKFGWMLCMLDLVMVPFIFPLQAYYLYKIGPFEYSLPYTILVASMHIIGYLIFDTANSQKDFFREKYGEEIPKGFPRLPWGKLNNPKSLKTERGTNLLIDGWWKYSRHMNYLGDMMMSWSWGLTCGFGSYFPYAYTTYLTPLLFHRERRDNHDCQHKYGKDWDRYCRIVPYRIIPYIY